MNRKKTIRGWNCVSRSRTVQGSGVRIERRGLPKTPLGWYLVRPDGSDEALSVSRTRKAVLDELTRIITKD